MDVLFSEEARLVIAELERFVEERNTKGAGKRFTSKFKQHILDYSKLKVHLPCKFLLFIKRNLYCFILNDWIIAYESQPNKFIVRTIIHGSLLEY
jgi:hypothetical protein